jgi:hypothetical protein
MKIVIENTKFPFDLGCKLLKLRYNDCPYEQLEDIWDSIVPATFQEISELENLEQRRVGIVCLGIDRIAEQVKPRLVDSQTIEKVSNFINKDGKIVKEKFSDTYELYEVKGEQFSAKVDKWRTMDDCYFVKFKDTSTDRKYMIWIDPRSVFRTNPNKQKGWYEGIEDINAIQSIAWTIQTNVAEGNIKEILRQGDCIFVKPKDSSLPLLDRPRHLTEKEYRKFLVAES